MAGRFCLWTFLLVLSSTLLNFSASLPVRRERSTEQRNYTKQNAIKFVLKVMFNDTFHDHLQEQGYQVLTAIIITEAVRMHGVCVY